MYNLYVYLDILQSSLYRESENVAVLIVRFALFSLPVRFKTLYIFFEFHIPYRIIFIARGITQELKVKFNFDILR